MKIIKIFLASSIVEFKNERKDLDIFIRSQISDEFEEKYNIKIRPILCENIDPCMSKDGKQIEYNNLIKGCEMCFFIFFTRAGEITQEEFKIAYDQFRKSENHKPKVYVYFKNVPEGMPVEQSVKDFMQVIDKKYQHYYGTFDHIDTIKLRILLNLKIQEMDFIKIEIKNDKCLVDGNEVLSLENVSEFMNSKELQKLKLDLANIEEKYFKMKPLYAKGEIDDNFRKEYIDVAAKRQGLIDLIEELQKNIFELSLNLSKDEVYGWITPREKEAYRLLEKGDREGCLEILNFEEIKNDYQQKKLKRKIEAKRDAQIFIRENKLAIEILETMESYPNRFEEITDRYEAIILEAEENLVELNVIHNYAEFLGEQNQYKKAIEIAEQLKVLYTNECIEVDVEDYLNLLQTLGIFHYIVHNFDLAEKYYKLILKKINNTNYENPNKPIFLANCYNNLGVLYLDLNNFKDAETNYNNALEIHRSLAKDNFKDNLHFLATSYNNLGGLYCKLKDFKKAEEVYLKALEIYIQYAEKNLEEYGARLAKVYRNLGHVYHRTNRFIESEVNYKNAVRLLEKLTINNPEAFEPHLVDTLETLSLLYRDIEDFDKAEELLKSVIVKYKLLVALSPEAFNHRLASAYSTIASLYTKTGSFYEAEKYYLKALKLKDQLVASNFDAFGEDIAVLQSNMGLLYCDMNRFSESEELLTKALRIYEELNDKNVIAFKPALAHVHIQLGRLYSKITMTGNSEYIAKAEEFFIKALNIYELLALRDQQTFERELIDVYCDLGNFYYLIKQYDNAENNLKKAIEIIENTNNVSIVHIAETLAFTYGVLGDLYNETLRYEDAKKCLIKKIEIYENNVRNYPINEVNLLESYFKYGVFLLNLKDNEAEYFLIISYYLALKNEKNIQCTSIIQQLEKMFDLNTPYKKTIAKLYSLLYRLSKGVKTTFLQEIINVLGDCIMQSSEYDKNILEKIYYEYVNELQRIINIFNGDIKNHHDTLTRILNKMLNFCKKVLNPN